MRLIALRFFLSGDAAPAVTSPLVMQVGAGPWTSFVSSDGNEKAVHSQNNCSDLLGSYMQSYML